MKSSTGSFHILRLLLICSFALSGMRTTYAETDATRVIYTVNAEDSARILYKLNFLQTYDGFDSLKGTLMLSTLNHLYAAEPNLDPEVASLALQYVNQMYDDYFTGPLTQTVSSMTAQSVLTPEEIQSGTISRLKRLGQEIYANVKDYWITQGNAKDVLVGTAQDLGVDMSKKILAEGAKTGLTEAAKQAWKKVEIAPLILFSYHKQLFTNLYKSVDWKNFPSDAYDFIQHGGIPDNVDQAVQMSGAQTIQVSPERVRALRDGAVDIAFRNSKSNAKMAKAMNSAFAKNVGVDVGDSAKDILTKKPNLLPDMIKQKGFVDSNGNISASIADLNKAKDEQVAKLIGEIKQKRSELVVLIQQQTNLSLSNEQVQILLADEPTAKAEEKKIQDDTKDFNETLLKSAEGTIYVLSTIASVIPGGEGVAKVIDVVGNAAIKTVEAIQTYQKAVEVLKSLGAVGQGFAAGGLIGGLVSVVASLFSLFGGPSPEQQILDEVHALREELQQVRKEMHERFDIIDAKLDAGFANLGRQLDRLQQLEEAARVEVLSGLAQLQSDVYQVQTRLGDYFCQNLLDELKTTIYQGIWIPRITGQPLTESEYKTHRNALVSTVRVKAVSGICDKQPNGGPLPSDLADETVGKRIREDIRSYVGSLNTMNAWLKLKTSNRLSLSDQTAIPYYGIWVLAVEAYRDLALDNLNYSINDGTIRDEFKVGGMQIRNALEKISNTGTVDKPKANRDLVMFLTDNYSNTLKGLMDAFQELHQRKQNEWLSRFMMQNERQSAKLPYPPNGWFQPTDWDTGYDPLQTKDPSNPLHPPDNMKHCRYFANQVIPDEEIKVPNNVRRYLFGSGQGNIPPVIKMADYMGLDQIHFCYELTMNGNFNGSSEPYSKTIEILIDPSKPSPSITCNMERTYTRPEITIQAKNSSIGNSFYLQYFYFKKILNHDFSVDDNPTKRGLCGEPTRLVNIDGFQWLKDNYQGLSDAIDWGCWPSLPPTGTPCELPIGPIANKADPNIAAGYSKYSVVRQVGSMHKEFYTAALNELNQTSPYTNLSLALGRYDSAREMLNAFIQLGFPRAFSDDESLRALLVSPAKSQVLPSAQDIKDQVSLFAESIDPKQSDPYAPLRNIYCGDDPNCVDGNGAPLTTTGIQQLINSEAPPSMFAALDEQIYRSALSRLYQLKHILFRYLDAIDTDQGQATDVADFTQAATQNVPNTPLPNAKFQIVAFHSSKCLAITGGSDATGDGIGVEQQQCLGASATHQMWQLIPRGNSYQIRAVNSGKCLNLQHIELPFSPPYRLEQDTCQPPEVTNQLFNIVQANTGFLLVSAFDGSCITISGLAGDRLQIAGGLPAIPFPCGNNPSLTPQIFNLRPEGEPIDPGPSKTYIKPYQEMHLGIETALSSLGALSSVMDTIQRGLPTLSNQRWNTFLPAMMSNFDSNSSKPELVSSFTLSPNQTSFKSGEPVTITVTIANQGTAASGPFWIDLYINPAQSPTTANLRWNDACTFDAAHCWGIAWYVTTSLAPGKSITLVSTLGSYDSGQTRWPGWFTSGTTDLYVYADSFNPGVATGLVAESNEGNNRAEIHGLSVIGPTRVVQAPDALQNPVEQRMIVK